MLSLLPKWLYIFLHTHNLLFVCAHHDYVQMIKIIDLIFFGMKTHNISDCDMGHQGFQR